MFFGIFLLIECIRTVSFFSCCILVIVKTKMEVADLSRIKSEGFCSFLTEVHFGIGKWGKKETWIYFTQQLSFKGLQGREKSA